VSDRGACSETQLAEICRLLVRHTGHDFSGYRATTLTRRVDKRLQARRVSSAEYVEILSRDASEAQALLADVLVSVTSFFRDPEAFAALVTSALPALIDHARNAGVLRAWVPACATGEEAYSLAILLKDEMRARDLDIPLQIFSTDIDRPALERARLGQYPATIAEQVPPAQLDRYFRPFEDGYRVVPELREACLFSEHNLAKDPPFSRLDLVSCRNLFIYFTPNLQSRVIPTFHYALRADGFLFLGPSENMADTSETFRVVDAKHRVFVRLPGERPLRPAAFEGRGRGAVAAAPAQLQPFSERDVVRRIATALLEHHAPPAIVVNAQSEVLFYSGRTGRYLEAPTGGASRNLFDLLHRPLRGEVHALLHRALQTGETAERPALVVELDGAVVTMNLVVRPLPASGAGQPIYIVVFAPIAPPRTPDQAIEQGLAITRPDAALQDLEAELRDTRDHLQSTIEEVRSYNEELLSMNEELQSTNEELQTSKEELQSTNEELETVNSELTRKIDELDHAHGDLQNFFANTQVPTIFLDEQLCIRSFTPVTSLLFSVIAADIGRPLSDIATPLDDLRLAEARDEVFRTLQPIEREVTTRDGKQQFILRVSPYRTLGNRIDGLVVTFVEVTELVKSHAARDRLAAIVDSSDDAIIGKDLQGTVTSWNEGAERMFGYTAGEMVGTPIYRIVPTEHPEDVARILHAIQNGERVSHYETVRLRKDGQPVHVSLSVSPVRDQAGRVVGASKIARDIGAQKRAEEGLQRALRLRDDFISIASHELRTPLTAMKITTDLMSRHATAGQDAWPSDRAATASQRLARQVERLATLIDALLDVSRIGSGKLLLVRAPVDLSEVVREAAEELEPRLRDVGCQLRLDLAPNLVGSWDHTRLEQVVVNLLTNVIRYAPGRPVVVRTASDARRVSLEVSDQGPGIAAADHERIFERFERANGRADGGAFGIGLYIVREVVRAHGGTIAVASVPGAGATFRVVLPKEPTDALPS
jgi:two-component system, chemotaxis family, CheB/CheR fusion protein